MFSWALLLALFCMFIPVVESDVLADLSPVYREFDTKEELAESEFWNDIVTSDSLSPKHLTAIHIKQCDTMLLLKENNILGVGLTLGKWFGNWKSDIVLTEIDLGEDKRLVGSDYFPIVTLSAEYTNNTVRVEREINMGRSVTFAPQAERAFEMLQAVRSSLQISQNSLVSQKELVNCAANPGGRVQLQVSNRMIHYPEARFRAVKFKRKQSEFVEGKWEMARSAMKMDRFVGALFYENSGLGKHRCVTNVTHFENPTKRKWIEYSVPFAS